MNVLTSYPIGKHFLTAQDEYLEGELSQKGITSLAAPLPIADGIYLWQGDNYHPML